MVPMVVEFSEALQYYFGLWVLPGVTGFSTDLCSCCYGGGRGFPMAGHCVSLGGEESVRPAVVACLDEVPPTHHHVCLWKEHASPAYLLLVGFATNFPCQWY